ncbi:cAMP-regulated phosphoprotein 21 [Parasteatoda tepidariorum]|uniref:cAMP-regulated phosphoprotein 21 n=1 Tax=Parasteatoda tepidariorum TaxID=114398 RepID=A0A2L2Y6D2_PARTP|nr:cAMP-regulated phosphoprotein 21 [Parasteatoda tepidariorum]
MEGRRGSRPSRLEKQEEFEVEDEGGSFLSPVTIQIEDRGEDFICEFQHADSEESSTYEVCEEDLPDVSDVASEKGPDGKLERKKAACRMKVLVRSHAVHEDASPPPDLESVIANTNMLSVTNAPSFVTQSKGTLSKSRLGNQSSSQGSTESSSTSGISRDSSTENYTDSSGIDLQQFIIDTLHKNQKDRLMVLKIEQELINLIKDNKKHSIKFPQMSSYNRMLVHRVAAFFGLDHYVDGNGTSVIVNKTKTSRIPDTRFQDFIKDELLPEEPKKSILKRDSISFEEEKERSPERQSSTDSRRSKSFEEREEEYEKARARIFNQDEGIGGSPLNRSQEGAYPEDVRWPSELRPWSSTDSESSGRPLGSRISSSFESDVPTQGKVSRSFTSTTKVEPEKPLTARSTRPVMKKASSFGGISVLSRDGSCGRTFTPKITKAESFNVTSISDCPVITCEVSVYSQESHIYAISSFVTADNAASVSAQDTCPLISIQPIEVEVPLIKDPEQATTESGNKELSKDIISTSSVSLPLMWPYSSGTDMLYTDACKHFQSAHQKATPSSQNVSGSVTDQVPTSIGSIPSRTAPSSPTHLCHPQSSQLLPQIQPQSGVNTSSQTAFYVPYGAPSKPVGSHLSPHPPRPFILFPVCYLQHTSNVHALHQVVCPTTQQSAQSSSQTTLTSAGGKGHTTVVTTHILNSQCMSCYSTLAHSANTESTFNKPGASTSIYPHGKSGTAVSLKPSSSFPSQLSQPPVCMQFHIPSNLPPVYVSVTSSTQSPATRTHAGGHAAVQFSSLRSQSLPVQSNSGVGVLHPAFNSGTGQFLGYTVYTPASECLPAQSPLTIVTIGPNTSISAQAPQFVPAYMSAYQILQTNVPPLAATIGNTSTPLPHMLHSDYPASICTMSKMPVSFPLVKQASDPGIAEHAALANNFYFVGPPVQQHMSSVLLPQPPAIARFPGAPISHRAPTSRPIKPRKQRSKGSNPISASQVSQTILEGDGNHILEVIALPENIKQNDLGKYLEPLCELGAQIHLMSVENLKSIEVSDELVSKTKHVVLAVFGSDKAAQDALLRIKTPKFQLRPWHSSQDCSRNIKKV